MIEIIEYIIPVNDHIEMIVNYNYFGILYLLYLFLISIGFSTGQSKL